MGVDALAALHRVVAPAEDLRGIFAACWRVISLPAAVPFAAAVGATDARWPFVAAVFSFVCPIAEDPFRPARPGGVAVATDGDIGSSITRPFAS